jgi:hypothetical protein
MMAGDLAASWINREIIGRENILPCPFFARVGVFTAQRIGKMGFPISTRKIAFIQIFHFD